MSRLRFTSEQRAVFGVKRLCRVLACTARGSTPGWPGPTGGPPVGLTRSPAGPAGPPRHHRHLRVPTDHRRAARPRRSRQPQRVERLMPEHEVLGSTCAAGITPPAATRPRRPPPTCWAATSPHPVRIGAGAGTSPTCGSPTASCTWRPCWSCTRGGRPAGVWPGTPAPSWPVTRWRPQPRPAAAPSRGGVPHRLPRTPRRPSPGCATTTVCPSRWAALATRGQRGRRGFFAALKRELGARWASVEQARLAVFSWIAFYDHRRRHSALGDHSPADYERITAHQQPGAA